MGSTDFVSLPEHVGIFFLSIFKKFQKVFLSIFVEKNWLPSLGKKGARAASNNIRLVTRVGQFWVDIFRKEHFHYYWLLGLALFCKFNQWKTSNAIIVK